MELIDVVRQYATIRAQIKEITDREKLLKEQLREHLLNEGEVDDKGSYVLEIDDEMSKVAKVINQRRVSKQFDPDAAEAILTERNLLDRCTVMVPILDEGEILASRYEDLLSDEDIDKMFPAKESFAIVVVNK